MEVSFGLLHKNCVLTGMRALTVSDIFNNSVVVRELAHDISLDFLKYELDQEEETTSEIFVTDDLPHNIYNLTVFIDNF